MADSAAVDELIAEMDDHLAEQLEDAIRRTLTTASIPHDCQARKCGCVYDAIHRRDFAGFWSPSNWPAMVTILDGEIVELEGEFSKNKDLSASWRRGVCSGQINQLGGWCRE